MKKIVYIQFPDNTIHDVEVYKFCKTENNMYYIEYFDLIKQIDMYTVLSNINNTLINIPDNEIPFDTLSQNAIKLDLNILPGYIPCITLINKKEIQTIEPPKAQTQNQFIVYVDQNNNKYITKNITNKYGITNKDETITVDGITYVKVYQSNIDDIIKKSGNTETPIYKDYYNNQVSNYDAPELTKEQGKPIDPPYVHVHHIMSYYYDMQDNKYYLDREGLDIARKYNVEIEGTPTIALDKNCYSITKEQIENLKEKTIEMYSWIEKAVLINKDKPTIKSVLAVHICNIDNNNFIPLDIFKKYKLMQAQKLIKVDGIIYINVTEDDLAEIKMSYSKDHTEIVLINKKIRRKTNELENMLDISTREDREKPTQK
ncbi:MAG: hypothetical protein IKF47_01630 [Bacilli bacterium]|nr:hypothetical protein [Bacilli bacterium]